MSAMLDIDSKNQYIRIQGDLTCGSVMEVLTQFHRECKSLASWTIDLTRVSKVDSSAIALLVELKRIAREQNRRISFIQLPPALMSIARLSQVDELLQETG